MVPGGPFEKTRGTGAMSVWKAEYQDLLNMDYIWDHVHSWDGEVSTVIISKPYNFFTQRVLILLHKLGMR